MEIQKINFEFNPLDQSNKEQFSQNNIKEEKGFKNILEKSSNEIKAKENNFKDVENKVDSIDKENNIQKEDVLEDKVKDIKDTLKKYGIEDKEIKEAEDLEDIKKILLSKLKDEKLKGKIDVTNILSLINIFAKDTKIDIKEFVQKLGEILKDNINMFSSKGNISEDNLLKALNKIKDTLDNKNINSELKNKIENILDKNFKEVFGKEKIDVSDFISKVKMELGLMLKEKASSLKSNKSSKDLLDTIKLNLKDVKKDNLVENKNSQSKSEEKNQFLGNSSKEEEVLKGMTSKDNKNKLSKVTNFMNQFNNINNTDKVSGKSAKVIVNKANFNNDVIKAFKYMDLNNMKQLTVKIVPKELGEVVISLTMEAGVMKANITAHNKEAYNLLNSNIQDISDKLQNNDIKIQNFDINLYEDTTFFKQGSSEDMENSGQDKKKSNPSIQKIDGELTEEIEENMSNEDNNLNLFA